MAVNTIDQNINFILRERFPQHGAIRHWEVAEQELAQSMLTSVFTHINEKFELFPLPYNSLVDIKKSLCKYYKKNIYLFRYDKPIAGNDVLLVFELKGNKNDRYLRIQRYAGAGPDTIIKPAMDCYLSAGVEPIIEFLDLYLSKKM